LELALVVGFCALGLYVLLDGVDLRLILDQLLLDVVQAVVDLGLENLVLLGVVLHRVVRNLLAEPISISIQEFLDLAKSYLFLIKLDFEIIGLGELVGHIILHLRNLVLSLLHFLMDSALKVLDFLQILVDLVLLDSKSGSCSFGVFKLALFELQIIFHLVDLRTCWQLILSRHRSLHMLK